MDQSSLSRDLVQAVADETSAASVAQLYRDVRNRTEQLCAPLSAEDTVVQSMPDTSPTKWHLAHTAWFFETFVLEKSLHGYRSVHPSYRMLFNSYYNAVGPMHARPQRGLLTRPSLDEVLDYRRRVDEDMDRLLASLDRGSVAQDSEKLLDVVVLGLHHEQQHQELILTDIKHTFACSPLRPAYHDRRPPRASNTPPLRWLRFEEGICEVGHDGVGFSFDNERPRHRAFLEGFEIASRPVTCGELVAFIEAGGYSDPALWLSDGWAWVQTEGVSAPLYWERRDGDWAHFTLAGVDAIDPGAPACHLSFYEAHAFARWAGARLPTEQEWEVAAQDLPVTGNLADDGFYQPMQSAADVFTRPSAMFGDVWEWTASAYLPYPGYREPEGALGEYNAKFMSGQMVLRGGSCATPRLHVRPTYRNFFYPTARWQFSGLRLARDSR